MVPGRYACSACGGEHSEWATECTLDPVVPCDVCRAPLDPVVAIARPMRDGLRRCDACALEFFHGRVVDPAIRIRRSVPDAAPTEPRLPDFEEGASP